MAKETFGRTKDTTAPYPYPDWINPELEKRLDLRHRWSDYWSAIPPDIPCRNPKIYQSVLTPDWNTDDKYMSCGITLPEHRSPFLDLRLINFMASLPALPWLFNKHVLRKSMLGKLPGNVLRRPKTPLGFIHDSLIINTDDKVLNGWKSTQELTRYIDRSNLPILNEASVGAAESYINLRPLLLNQWLCELGKSANPATKMSVISHL